MAKALTSVLRHFRPNNKQPYGNDVQSHEADDLLVASDNEQVYSSTQRNNKEQCNADEQRGTAHSVDVLGFEILRDFIGGKKVNMWDVDCTHTLTGQIAVHELVLTIFGFVQPHKQTLLSLTAVSHGWRERANFMPQWATVAKRERIFGWYPGQLGLPSRAAVHSHDVYVQKKLAEQVGPYDERRKREQQIAWEKKQGSLRRKWLVLPHVYHWLIVSATVSIGFAVGYVPTNSIEGDASIGAASGCIGFLMWVCFIVPFHLYAKKMDEKHNGQLLCEDAIFCLGRTSTLVMFIATVIVALLGARLQALVQLNDMPTLELTCNMHGKMHPQAEDMPSQVHVPNTTVFHVMNNSIHFDADADIAFILVASTSPSICHHRDAPTNHSFQSNHQPCPFPGNMAVMAISVPKHKSTYNWPPKNGSAFFRTPTDQKYFAEAPPQDRVWYEKSTFWKDWGVPLVTPAHYDDLAKVKHDYAHYLFCVLMTAAGVAVLVPLGALFPHTWTRETWTMLVCLISPVIPLGFLVFATTCAWSHSDLCMIDETSAWALGGVLVVVFICFSIYCVTH